MKATRLRRLVIVAWLVLCAGDLVSWARSVPRGQGDTLRFAVIGDSGTGEGPQYEVGKRMAEFYATRPFEFVLMVGDNLYGRERPQDYEKKFVAPYRPLLDAGVDFYATLGNHDDLDQRYYKLFNMDGQRYYTFEKGSARFFALDSNYMDPEQIAWLDRELERSGEEWKIAFFHHPLYSSGARHGSEVDLRKLVEPLFVRHGVDVVFAGHEHFYERLKPQQGITYFTVGGSAKLRKGNIRKGPLNAAGFDQDRSFFVAEIVADKMTFQAISRTGNVVDSGTVANRVVGTTGR
ncbi:MAG: metallophosphoesterase [Vicinamibacterales bacterium]